MPAVDPKAAVDALRRRYEESVAHVRGKQHAGNVQAAEAASARGDFAEAARLYRAATQHSSDPGLRAVLVQTETKAKEQNHAAAIARAKEAEGKQDYTDAGANWARAFDLVPSAETAHRASLCFRRAGVDPRRAAKYGEEAVKLDPNKASYRVTLALIYADAGLVLRARGEIERAQALEPQNPLVKGGLARDQGDEVAPRGRLPGLRGARRRGRREPVTEPTPRVVLRLRPPPAPRSGEGGRRRRPRPTCSASSAICRSPRPRARRPI